MRTCTASLVRPGSGPVRHRSSCSSQLLRVDLPCAALDSCKGLVHGLAITTLKPQSHTSFWVRSRPNQMKDGKRPYTTAAEWLQMSRSGGNTSLQELRSQGLRMHVDAL